jgi:hypothetical protein
VDFDEDWAKEPPKEAAQAGEDADGAQAEGDGAAPRKAPVSSGRRSSRVTP